MLKSMTGFGKAKGDVNGRTLNVEVRSVNSKTLDLNTRITQRYRDRELIIRNEVARELERGKIDLSIYYDASSATKPVSINKALAKQYFEELKELNKELGIADEGTYMSMLLRMPEIYSQEEQADVDDKEWSDVLEVIKAAFFAFNSFRLQEGKSLGEDFSARIATIERILKEIEVFEPQRVEAVRQRIRKSLEEWSHVTDLDNNRMEQEMIYYIEKLDITEEKVRLRTHCDYFLKTMQEANSGRKLNFITQEIGREINTIGSKANDAGIQKLVVLMKDELEKIKEQVLNVL